MSLTKGEAAQRRDYVIEVAGRHADAENGNWTGRAYGYLLEWLATVSQTTFPSFLAEDVREFAEGHGLDAPPDGRAWGAVFRRAAKLGTIKRVGYAPAKSSHLAPKCLWSAA